MIIGAFEIFNFRNFQHVAFQPSSTINIFYGQNGSGKTSLLEAIHFLGLGRSFRTRHAHKIVHHDRTSFTLITQLQPNIGNSLTVGFERQITPPNSIIRIAGKPARSLIELASLLPLQLLNADSHLLITSGPLVRRQFLDWGTFHVEHAFFDQWQRVRRLLKQRNAALKTIRAYHQVYPWDRELAQAATLLNHYRSNYVDILHQCLPSLINTLLPNHNLRLHYFPGWNTEYNLEDILKDSFSRDRQLGYTQQGPQRADLQLKINNTSATEILSQGQQKLAAYALRIAQAQSFKLKTGNACIFLIDDLPSELDHSNRNKIANILKSLEAQFFITGIDRESFETLESFREARMFHVEHSGVTSCC